MNYFANISFFKLRNEVDYKIKMKTMSSIFNLNLKEFKEKGEGYFLSRIFTEASEIAESIVSNIWAMLLNLLWFIIGFFFAFKLSPLLTLITLVYVPFHLLIDINFGKLLKELNRELNELLGKSYEHISNVLKFAPIIRVLGVMEFLKNIYSQIFREYLALLFYQKRKTYSYGTISNIAQNLLRVILLFIAGVLILKKKFTIGGYIGFSNLIWQVIHSSEALFSIISSIYTVNSTIERFEELKESGMYSCEKVKLSSDKNIKLNMVKFSYDNRSIFENFSLIIKHKEKVLITGPNGAGKTTLCHLITGLLCPKEGEIETLPPDAFSYVPSNTPVLPLDLKKQIAMGIKEREQRLNELWNLLPIALNQSGNLSQGELQKINILRTLVKDAEVYIFDEPFQHLDSVSVKKLTELIKKYLKEKTVIIVSHREDLKKNFEFDRIIKIGGVQHENITQTSTD